MAKKCPISKEHADMGTRVEHCFFCNEKIGISLQERWDALADALPKETHQKMLDGINSGMSIGEAQRNAGIDDLMVACSVINRNIMSYQYLAKTAI